MPQPYAAFAHRILLGAILLVTAVLLVPMGLAAPLPDASLAPQSQASGALEPSAQTPVPTAARVEDGNRPRIGLVLSGGGARGAAHVGVLKVLEELRIPVDAVAGTSMGAIVGGLYASGLSAEEVERALTSINWQDAFTDRTSRAALTFRRKQDDQNFLVRLPLGLKKGQFILPKGLIQGQKLTQILRSLTYPVSAVDDFNQLPVPYRAVATDIETGQVVVLDHGDVATAMRASMSAPGVFAPITVDDRLLIDGGITANLPIDVARTLGVDRLIVVDVSFPLLPRDKLATALEVSNQAIAIMVRREALQQRATLGADDIVIDPPLGDASSVDFRRVRESIAVGEKAAREMAPRLAALTLDPETYARYVESRHRRAPAEPRIDFVRAGPRSQRYARTIEATFEPFVGRQLDLSELEERIQALYGLDNFETVDYRLVYDGERTGLEIAARRKSWGPNYVRFGMNLQDDFEGNNSFNAAARFIVTEINQLGAEWLSDIQIGGNPRFFTELYQPLNYGSRFFIAPQLELEARSVQVVDDQAGIAEYRLRGGTAGLDFGREFGNWGELRTGVRRGYGNAHLRIGDPTLPEFEFDLGELFVRFSYDKLDNVNFPRRGGAFTLQWTAPREALGAGSGSSDRVEVDWLGAQSFGRHTLLGWISGGSTLDSEDAAVQDFFSLGGFLRLSGLQQDSLSGPHYGIARLIYYRQIGRPGPGFLNVAAYAGASVEIGNVWERRGAASFGSARKDGSIFLGLDTFFGPLYLAAGLDDEKETAFYLFLGRTF